MKKYIAMLLTSCICLSVPITGNASQTEIGTNVPDYHVVTLEAEHASAYYEDEDDPKSKLFSVPRFSEPEFELEADICWKIDQVLLNGTDVTAQVTDGILKLPKVYENQEITVITTADHNWGEWISNDDGTHTRTCQEDCGTSENGTCTGGYASYFAQASCDICGSGHGALLTDTTAPTGEIKIGENKWNSLLNKVTFGLLFKETQRVTVTAADDSYSHNGFTFDKAVKIGYYLHSGKNALRKEELADKTFRSYKRSFNIDPKHRYVVYAKLTDHAGNVTYLSSDGILLGINDIDVIRLGGSDRYDTSMMTADELKAVLGIHRFQTAIIATGKEYADALSGSYLAKCKSAPILLTNGEAEKNHSILNYIQKNVEENAVVYILGGENAVPKSMEQLLTQAGYEVERLGGRTRYETNRRILEEAGVTEDGELIITTGNNFADSLSASAVGRPILLVNPKEGLMQEQKAVLDHFKNGKIYILGIPGAVTEENENAIRAYVENAEVVKLRGKDRYETSVNVAKEFFADTDKAVITTGTNYPDGLCGGTLAAVIGAPMILTKSTDTYAPDYAESIEIVSGYVLGGTNAVSDELTESIFSLESADRIIVR